MKKFTFLLAFSVIALMANSHNSKNLQVKIEQAHKKYLKFSEMVKYAEKQINSKNTVLKNAAAVQKLDSIVEQTLNLENQTWYYDTKDEYFYDSEVRNTAWKSSEWNSESNSWLISSQADVGYDNNDHVNSLIFYDRDLETDPLIAYSKMLIYYNPDGMQDSVLMYSKIESDTWSLNSKQIHHYNTSKQLVKTDMWAIDEDLGELLMMQSVVYTYTAAGKIETSTTNYNFDGEEILYSQTEYNYDGTGNLTSDVTSVLNFFTFALENSSRNSYKYAASGKVSESIYASWIEGVWVNQDKTESQFNASGDVSVDIYSTWNGSEWVENEKDEYLYGTAEFSDYVFPNFYMLFGMIDEVDLMFNKIITGMNYNEMINGSWVHNGKSTFYYSSGTSTKIDGTQNAAFSVYPNPAAELVNFKWNGNNSELTLEMYQITGAKVLEQKAISGKPVSLSKLVNGVYFYKLTDGKEVKHAGKLVKN